MTTTRPITLCPICKKPDTWQKDNTFRPFCSERCKLIDLGCWADESYKVPTDEKPFDHHKEIDE